MTAGAAQIVALLTLGIAGGVLGTLVGLGGGFVVLPVLRVAYGIAPATASGITLVMVLANAISGSFAYLRQRRADVRTAGLIAVTGIPASVLGTYLVGRVSFAGFDYLYGALLVTFFIYLVGRDRGREGPPATLPRGFRERRLVDAYGEEFGYLTNTPLVLLCGAAVGLQSSFFGVGGGIIFLMVFIALFRMPAHIVTATSTVAILLTAPAGVLAHAYARDIDWALAVPLAAGGLVGGQLGPRLARRMSSPRLLTALAAMLLIAALALVVKHLPLHV
jgi:uncharacterized membrane protein YfcA